MITPFVQSFFQSDVLGKLIFITLFVLSIMTWAVILQKWFLTRQAESEAKRFSAAFRKHKASPLNFEYSSQKNVFNPIFDVYTVLKVKTLELLNKNRHFTQNTEKAATLSTTDIDFIDTHVGSSIALKTQQMEKHLFVLATIVTLAPFLGLLGTVWGILVSFSEMQGAEQLASSSAVLSGLALALTTTVLGLIVAIPALIGYNTLRAKIEGIEGEISTFSSEVMATVELQYRQVDIK